MISKICYSENCKFFHQQLLVIIIEHLYYFGHIFFFFFAQSRIYPFYALLLLFPLNDNLVLFSFLLLKKFGVEYVLHFSIYRALIHVLSFGENTQFIINLIEYRKSHRTFHYTIR